MPHIIDAHSHYIPPAIAQNTAFFKVNWSDIDKHLLLMDQSGIEKSLLLYPTTDAHLNMGGWKNVCRIYNDAIAGIVKKFPGRFIGAGILPIDSPADFSDELKRIDDLNLRVISLASSYDGKYLDEEMFFPVYEFAQARKIPIHVHPQIINPIGEDRVRDPLLTPVLEYVFDVSMSVGKLMMGDVLQRYPGVHFIFAHFGGVLPIVKDRFDTTYQMLRRRNFVKDLGTLPSEFFKKLYFDMSGTKSPNALLCALEVVDADHVLWGSDFPANQQLPETLAALTKTHLDQGQKDRILAGNFSRLVPA